MVQILKKSKMIDWKSSLMLLFYVNFVLGKGNLNEAEYNNGLEQRNHPNIVLLVVEDLVSY